ncbi:MAG: DUF4390 domain-containing protein [Thermodesulfobacteria bacterium]|nr:DUF4390 domain-containing protein [Thermodesulfobacteriota bacterium]
MKRSLLLFVVALFLFVPCAWALEIVDLSVGGEKGYLVASWRLTDVPFAQLDEALRHGVPLKVIFEIRILELRTLRRDKEILRHQIVREIYYDSVKKLYFVQFVGLPELPRQATSLEEAMEMAGNLRALPLLPLHRLRPGKTYRLMVRCILVQTITPGLPSRVLRFVFRSGKIESDWASIRFKL